MKRKFQKLLALIMAMAMCLSLLQTTAFAVEAEAEADASSSAVAADEGAAEESAEADAAEDDSLDTDTVYTHNHTFTCTVAGTLSYETIDQYVLNHAKQNQGQGIPSVPVKVVCEGCGLTYTEKAYTLQLVSWNKVTTEDGSKSYYDYTVSGSVPTGTKDGVVQGSTILTKDLSTNSVTTSDNNHNENVYKYWPAFELQGRKHVYLAALKEGSYDNVLTTTCTSESGETYTVLAKKDGTPIEVTFDAQTGVLKDTVKSINEQVVLKNDQKPGTWALAGTKSNGDEWVALSGTKAITGHTYEARYDQAKYMLKISNGQVAIKGATDVDRTDERFVSNSSSAYGQLESAVKFANQTAYYQEGLTAEKKQEAMLETAAIAYAFSLKVEKTDDQTWSYSWDAGCTNEGCDGEDVRKGSGKAVKTPAVCGVNYTTYYTATIGVAPLTYTIAFGEKETVNTSSTAHDWERDYTLLTDSNTYYLYWKGQYETFVPYDSTCAAEGKAVYGRKCKNCNAVIDYTKRDVAKKDHIMVEVKREVTQAATCTRTGFANVTYECSVCGGNKTVQTETIDTGDAHVINSKYTRNTAVSELNDAATKLNPSQAIKFVSTDVTCKAGVVQASASHACAVGWPEYYKCAVCGDYISGGVAYSSLTALLTNVTANHNWKVTYSFTTNPKSCTAKTADGFVATKTCTVCGKSEKIATVTTKQSKETYYKSLIDTLANESTYALIPFTYKDTKTVATSCGEGGKVVRTYYCPDCGGELTSKEIELSSKHMTGETKEVAQIKIDDKGNYKVWYRCTDCGMNTDEWDTHAADYSNFEYTYGCAFGNKPSGKATYDAAGNYIYSKKVTVVDNCQNPAGYYYTVTVGDKTVNSSFVKTGTVKNTYNHLNVVSAHNAKAATCVEAGKEADMICADCGAVVEAGKEIPATGEHTYKLTDSVASTYTSYGSETYTCSVCGETKIETMKDLKKLAKGTIKSVTAKKGGKVVVKIKKVTGAKKYRVCWSYDGKNWKTLNDTTKTSITLKGLKAGKKVQIKVRPVATAGKVQNLGSYSAVKKVTVKK